MYARIENDQIAEYPLTEHDIRQRFPLTSFTTDFASGLPDGYVSVRPGSYPSDDPLKIISEGSPVYLDGLWVQTWVQSDKYTESELAAINAQKELDKWVIMRGERDDRIQRCSWIIERHRDQKDANSPTSITDQEYQLWLAYRQSLRDLPASINDIDNIQWPDAPDQLAITVL